MLAADLDDARGGSSDIVLLGFGATRVSVMATGNTGIDEAFKAMAGGDEGFIPNTANEGACFDATTVLMVKVKGTVATLTGTEIVGTKAALELVAVAGNVKRLAIVVGNAVAVVPKDATDNPNGLSVVVVVESKVLVAVPKEATGNTNGLSVVVGNTVLAVPKDATGNANGLSVVVVVGSKVLVAVP